MIDDITIKVINLEHRKDRFNECIEIASRAGVSLNQSNFFSAKHLPNDGARGCALSHAKVISDYLFEDDKSFLLVLEDDFEIRNKEEFSNNLRKIINQNEYWDVYLLGHNQAVPIEGAPLENSFRVINSQTASGYIVKRDYAPTLIETFFRSATLLKNYSTLSEDLRNISRIFFACDMLWKELQLKDRFLATFPSLIFQRESHSDIENKLVNYGV
jgi:GR25 family glycosyltransferase involved in LPS biosynthesis